MPFTIPGLITEAIIKNAWRKKFECMRCGDTYRISVGKVEKLFKKHGEWHGAKLGNYCEDCRPEKIKQWQIE